VVVAVVVVVVAGVIAVGRTSSSSPVAVPMPPVGSHSVSIPCGSNVTVALPPATEPVDHELTDDVYSFAVPTQALAANGAVTPVDHDKLPTPAAMTRFFAVEHPEVIDAELALDRFRSGARAEWDVGAGVAHILEMTFANRVDAARFLAQELDEFCSTSTGVGAISGASGVTYSRTSGGETSGRASVLAGSSVINFTVCGCVADSQGVAAAWARQASSGLR
jgi:hypothetical protein